MARFITLRLVHAAGIVFLVATLTFFLVHLSPGDPFTTSSQGTLIPAEVIEQQRRNFGMDQPVYVQYLRYLGNIVRGDFGYSFREHRPAAQAIAERVPNTLLLAATALVITFGVGVLVGALQAAKEGSPLDDALSLLTLTLYSMPVFWLGVMLLLLFGVQLGWLPVGGVIDEAVHPFLSPLGRLTDRLAHLVLPALTLGLMGAAATARFQRAEMLEVIGQDFVRTARAKGLTPRGVFLRHALRNALLPAVTLFGLSFPLLLSGSVLVETVFAWPGMGKLAVDAIHGRDYAVVTAVAIIAAVMVVLGNLLADLLYRVVDPRTRSAR